VNVTESEQALFPSNVPPHAFPARENGDVAFTLEIVIAVPPAFSSVTGSDFEVVAT
jgi:hypothetical protein